MDFYTTLVGMIDLNGANVEALPAKDERDSLLKRQNDTDLRREEDLPYRLASKDLYLLRERKMSFLTVSISAGLALFVIHSCLNHSCEPNAEVVGGLLDAADARIKVRTSSCQKMLTVGL